MADSQARQVRQFVEDLDRNDRYIVMLYYADGLTPMEISRVLDLPSTSVRTRLQELMSQLTSMTRRRPAKAKEHDGHSGARAAYA